MRHIVNRTAICVNITQAPVAAGSLDSLHETHRATRKKFCGRELN